ncbi:MAG: hypothetical protein NTV34_19280 [Proteobacteria bacterium]|nr:hypothetical protein [Pseudomonadota bacterium]
MSEEEIVNIILGVANRIMLELPAIDQRPLSKASCLLGGDSVFDSLSFVSVIVELEEAILAKFGTTLTLADERAMSQPTSPFLTVESLARYVQMLLTDNNIK